MKKTIILSLVALAAGTISAAAQNMYDAINFSRNDYLGTARTMALGNAVTAIGGDLGTVGINPAGSAVATYGQLTVTPGFTLSSVSSAYSPEGESMYGPSARTTRSRLSMPNLGVSLVMNTGRRSGLKSFTFAVVYNQTAQYNYAASAYGANSRTSKMAEFASAASGIREDILANYNSFDNSDVSWDVLTAYQAGMFGSYGTDGRYVGVTEMISPDGSYHYVPGALQQSSAITKSGHKNDLVFNFGFNVSDKFFFGFNLGTPAAEYRYSEAFYETAIDMDAFPISFIGSDGSETFTAFRNGTYAYNYTADIDGIYAKFGFIATPATGLRFGAAIQTPTAYTISERWQYAASTVFQNPQFNDSETSPQGEYTYCLRSPYVASFGAAYTFGGRGFISADYELTDYSVMRFSEQHPDYLSGDRYMDLNEANRHFAGLSHALRVGGELRLSPEFSLRAGVSLLTSPERHWTNNEGSDVTAGDFLSDFNSYKGNLKQLVSSRYYGDRTTSLSLGAGYSSPGSFFVDLAVKCTRYPDTVFSPYYDYDNYNAAGMMVSTKSPRITNTPTLWNAALTLGWRF